jgi:hypothetical protein
MIFNCKKPSFLGIEQWEFEMGMMGMMGMMGTEENKVVGCLDAGVGEARIEIVLGERDGRQVVMLQLSTWHETLGWQAQKTIPLALEKIGQLQRLLSQTRNKVEDRRRAAGAPAQVIEFALRGQSYQPSISNSLPANQTADVAKTEAS